MYKSLLIVGTTSYKQSLNFFVPGGRIATWSMLTKCHHAFYQDEFAAAVDIILGELKYE